MKNNMKERKKEEEIIGHKSTLNDALAILSSFKGNSCKWKSVKADKYYINLCLTIPQKSELQMPLKKIWIQKHNRIREFCLVVYDLHTLLLTNHYHENSTIQSKLSLATFHYYSININQWKTSKCNGSNAILWKPCSIRLNLSITKVWKWETSSIYLTSQLRFIYKVLKINISALIRNPKWQPVITDWRLLNFSHLCTSDFC